MSEMKMSKPPVLKCKYCYAIIKPEIDDFDDPETSQYERNMGVEIEYTWEYAATCPSCNNDISVTVEGWEYPVGIFNYEESTSVGCLITEKPALEVEFEEPMGENDHE